MEGRPPYQDSYSLQVIRTRQIQHRQHLARYAARPAHAALEQVHRSALQKACQHLGRDPWIFVSAAALVHESSTRISARILGEVAHNPIFKRVARTSGVYMADIFVRRNRTMNYE